MYININTYILLSVYNTSVVVCCTSGVYVHTKLTVYIIIFIIVITDYYYYYYYMLTVSFNNNNMQSGTVVRFNVINTLLFLVVLHNILYRHYLDR